jgi:hypothetical protein
MRWVPLVCAVLLLSGCFHHGESEDDASADYAAQANAICRESNARFDTLGKPPERGTAAYGRYLRQAQAIAKDVSAKMDRLDVPHNLDSDLRQWRNQTEVVSRRAVAVKKASAKVDADLRSDRRVSDSDTNALAAANRALLASTERLDRLTPRAGLSDCVRED